jgi:hypothetical protein
MAGYIGGTIPAKVVRVSGTTLFQIAMMETGDPLQLVAIAEMNGLTDPWITAQQDLLIPPIFPTGTQTGILQPAATPYDPTLAVAPTSAAVVAPAPPSGQSEPIPVIF